MAPSAFEGESHLPDGTVVNRLMALFNLGPEKIRQYSEALIDGGETWNL
jgi:hypothetical protein